MKVSICIPQFNRIEYLELVLSSIDAQTYDGIEVVISDDCSSDRTEEVIRSYQQRYRYAIIYERQMSNVGFDANLRRALELGTGDYLFVLGNDDAIADACSIENLVNEIKKHDYPGIFTSNYADFSTRLVSHRRVQTTALELGSVESAIRCYSCFSFVGGIGFRQDVFREVNSPAHDGSVYVQIYLAVMAMLRGHSLLKLSNVLVAKDVTVSRRKGTSYIERISKNWEDDLSPVTGGLYQVLVVIFSAIDKSEVKNAVKWKKVVTMKIYATTYPYWLVDYRRHHARPEAFRLFIGMNPLAHRAFLGEVYTFRLMGVYIISSIGGFLFPVFVFNLIENWLYAWLKSK
jgi:glycosyltransferase involved in cell wall biosynthesis